MLSVFGLGNPLMDIILEASPETLDRLKAVPGSMNLVEFETQKEVIGAAATARYSAGGSCANTIRGIAWLVGGDASIPRPAYTGSVGRDEYGDRFEASLVAQGVETRLARKDVPTGTSAIVVTPDHERTMFTHLGACREFTTEDLDLDLLRTCSIFHTTGYMWDTPNQEKAAKKAIAHARNAGILVSFDIADPFVAERYGTGLVSWLPGNIDILFANFEELKAMTRVLDGDSAESPEIVVRQAAVFAPIVALKVGAEGCLILRRPDAPARQGAGGPAGEGRRTAADVEVFNVAPERVRAKDTTAAGDAFAAGFLYAFLRGEDLARCGYRANRIASRIVTVTGCDYSALDRGDVLRDA